MSSLVPRQKDLIRMETTADLITLFENHKKDSYSASIIPFIDYWRDHPDLFIGTELLTGYRLTITHMDVKPGTKNNYMNAVRSRVREVMLYADIPVKLKWEISLILKDDYKSYKTQLNINPDKIISSQTAIKMLETDPEYAEWNRDRTVERTRGGIAFLITTGCRVSEMLGVTNSGLKKGSNYYETTVLGKGNKIRTVYVPHWVIEYIWEWHKGDTYLFENEDGTAVNRNQMTGALRRYTKATIGIELGPHAMRHSYGTEMIDKIGIKKLQRALGHSRAQTTIDYYVDQMPTPEDVIDHGMLSDMLEKPKETEEQ